MAKKSNKTDLLKKTMAELNKKFGANTLKFGSDVKVKERIPFDITEIDELIGGGVVCGNFSIVFGAESSAKTSSCYQLIGNAQKIGKVCVLVDLEHSFEPERAKLFEVDTKQLLLIEDIDYAEEAMDVVKKLCKEKVVDLVVIDSIQGFSPLEEQKTKRGVDRSIEEHEMAALAKKMDKFLRTTANAVAQGKAAVVLIGQTRTDISSFGAPQICTGGRSKDYWSVCSLSFRRGAKTEWPVKKSKEIIEDDDGIKHNKTIKEYIGFQCVIKLQKTKVSGTKVEGTEVRIPYYFKTGFGNDI